MISNAGHLYYRYYRDGYLSRLRNTSGRLFPFSTSDISTNGQAMVVDSKDDASLIEMAVHDVTGGMKISQLEYNDSYVYCCGRNGNDFSLLRINPYTYESEPLVRDNDYEIYSFTVLKDNTIIFNGLRLSDGKIILASINENRIIKVIEETGNTKVTLHRIQ